jgi:Flp pilus assembly protein TadG
LGDCWEETGRGEGHGPCVGGFMTRLASRQNRRPAATLVEFALVASVFLLILLGVFEYARFLFAVQLMDNAAREGARYAVVNLGTETTSGVQTYVDRYLAGQGANQLVGYSPSNNIAVYQADPNTGQNIGSAWQSAGWGTPIGVSVSGTYHPLLPGLLHLTGSISLQARCVMTTESN